MFKIIEKNGPIKIVFDEDTGVQYLVTKEGITPRLDRDGSVMLYDETLYSPVTVRINGDEKTFPTRAKANEYYLDRFVKAMSKAETNLFAEILANLEASPSDKIVVVVDTSEGEAF
jgi:hypothetical protein